MRKRYKSKPIVPSSESTVVSTLCGRFYGTQFPSTSSCIGDSWRATPQYKLKPTPKSGYSSNYSQRFPMLCHTRW